MTLTLALALSLNAAPSVVEQVHFAFRWEGGRFVAGHETHRVESDERGAVSFFPIGDRDLGPVDGALRVDVRAASAGGRALDTRVRAVRAGRGPAHLEVVRGSFVEVLHNRGDGVEQSFRFDRRPGRGGDLVVELDTSGRWVGQTARGHHFTTGRRLVAYGPATWVDADGSRHALETTHTSRGLRITVPAAVVAHSAFPAVIDPLLSSEFAVDAPVQVPPAGQQDAPAVGFDGTTWLVVWRDFRGGLGSDIYAARVDLTGAVLDPGGLAISTASGGQYQPAITFGAGQYYVSFSDTRAGGADIYGTRVTTAGVPLDGSGVSLTNATGLQVNSDVVFNGTDYLVVWEDLRQGGMNSPDVYGTRVSVSGAVLDPTPNLAVSAAAWGQYVPRVAADPGTGTALVVWEDMRNLESDIYGATVSAAGLVGGSVAINRATAAQDKADVGFNGTHFLVVWTDRRAATTGADIYAARVTPAGGVVDMAGVLISGAGGDQDWPAIAGGNGADPLVVWRDARNAPATDVFGTAVTASATPVAPAGIPVSLSPGAQAEPKLAGSGLRFLVAFSDTRNGNADIFATRFSLAGGPGPFAEDPAGLLVSTAANQQSTPAIASDGTDFFAVWQDFRDGGADLYGVRVRPRGSFIDASPFVVSAAAGNESPPVVAFDGLNYVVAWSDLRTGEANLYATRVSPAGVVLEPSGIGVAVDPGTTATLPAIVSLDGGSLIVWQQGAGGASDVFGARLSNAGVVLDPTGFPISAALGDQTAPKVTTHAGDYLVAWTDTRNGNADIFATRVAQAGVVLDLSGIVVSTGAQVADSVSVSSNGSTALFVWRDLRSGASNPDIFGARFTGGVVVDGSGLALASGPAITANPTVDWDEPRQRFTVFWDNTSTVATGELEGADVSVLGVASGHTSYGPGRMPLVRYSAAGPGLFGSNQFMPAPDHNFRAWLRLAGKRGAGATCTMDAQCLSGLCLSSGCAVSLDAGVPDAGADAGSVDAGGALEDGGVDAGLRDAGAESDAGPPSDAGVESDAGPTNDAGQVSDAGPASDAGLMSDAGPASDAGPTSDAGLMSDAGAAGDAGTFASDAGLQSREPHTLQVGCGCDTSPVSLLWALVLVLAKRRR